MLTAHYGVVMSHLHAAFGTWHFGGPEYFIAQHRGSTWSSTPSTPATTRSRRVTEPRRPRHRAVDSLRAAVRQLKKEME